MEHSLKNKDEVNALLHKLKLEKKRRERHKELIEINKET
jgi:hypothetical protein